MSSPLFSKYLSEIGRIPLLTAEQEIQLGCIVQHGLRRDASDVEKRASDHAQCTLIQSNLKLVVSIANRFCRSSVSLEEMTFEGNLGLFTAARRYNPAIFKTRFSTYATWWIQQAVREAGPRWRTVRLPMRCEGMLRRIRASRSFVEGATGQDVTSIAAETGLPVKQITRILGSAFTIFSLNICRCDDGNEDIESTIDNGEESPAETLMRDEEKDLLREVLSELNGVERHIVFARFGIDLEPVETLDDLATQYSVSRERIRQIQKTAMKKLRMRLKCLLA